MEGGTGDPSVNAGKIKEHQGSSSGPKVSGGQSTQEQRGVSFSGMRLGVQRKCHSTCPRRQGLVFQRRREAEGSDASVNFQLTAGLEACGMIVGCSQTLPASRDVLSPRFLTRRLQNRICSGVLRPQQAL